MMFVNLIKPKRHSNKNVTVLEHTVSLKNFPQSGLQQTAISMGFL